MALIKAGKKSFLFELYRELRLKCKTEHAQKSDVKIFGRYLVRDPKILLTIGNNTRP